MAEPGDPQAVVSAPGIAGKPLCQGLWIAVFGPDGVGKSAVIAEMKQQLAPLFSRVIQFHFRPRFARQKPDQPPVVDPHGQSPRGLLISILKLSYWLLDCWFGYLVVIRPCRRDSRLVIFDRYYPDIVVDPRRYRLPPSSLRFARWFAGLAPRPDLCVLLDAPAEVMWRRKAEISLAELQRQRVAYLAMFQTSTGKLIVNADWPVGKVAQRISAAVLARLADPAFRQREDLLLADF